MMSGSQSASLDSLQWQEATRTSRSTWPLDGTKAISTDGKLVRKIINIDRDVAESIRQQAFRERVSETAVVREILRQHCASTNREAGASCSEELSAFAGCGSEWPATAPRVPHERARLGGTQELATPGPDARNPATRGPARAPMRYGVAGQLVSRQGLEPRTRRLRVCCSAS